MSYSWKWFRAGRMQQVSLTCGADIAALAELDRKQWIAISMPTTGVRFDLRMLELMDTDHDGRIRTPEVLAAIDFLKAKNVDFDSLFSAGEAEEKALAVRSGWKPTPFPLHLTKGDNEILVVTHGGSRQHWFTFYTNAKN